MPDITNAEVVKYSNEVVRPLAETLRGLKARVDAALVPWNNTLSAFVPNDASLLEDERGGEGVSRLTGADLNSFIGKLTGFQSIMNQDGVEAAVAKPCVRALEIR